MENNSKCLVSVLALNVKGQLSKITRFFSDYNLNILRLVLSAADRYDKVHRTIAYVEGSHEDVDEMCLKLSKEENVLSVVNFKTEGEYIEKELCFVKMLSNNKKAKEITNMVKMVKGDIVVQDKNITIFKVEEREESINTLMDNIMNIDSEVGFYRSGMVAVSLDNRIDML